MAEEQVRIEIGFQGGQVLRLQVAKNDAETLRRKLESGGGGVVELAVEDGTCVVVASQVLYMTAHDRESRVGFGAA